MTSHRTVWAVVLLAALAGVLFAVARSVIEKFESKADRIEDDSFFRDGSTTPRERPPVTARVDDPAGPLRRASHLDHPRSIAPGQEFAVNVRLVLPDAVEPGDRLVSLAVEGDGPWELEVTVTSPELDIARGSNVGTLRLTRRAPSSPARFLLRAPDDLAVDRARVRVTYWHEARFLAEAEHTIAVRSPSPDEPNVAKASVDRPPAAPDTAPLALDLAARPPDLTVLLHRDPDDRNRAWIEVDSPHLQRIGRELRLPPPDSAWLERSFEELTATSSRGRPVQTAEPAPADARRLRLVGLGRQLWRRHAPEPFRDAFWALVDRLGPRFETIQIITDDPSFPWELMRPTRDDGAGEREFLGLEFAVARWHLAHDVRSAPPATVRLDRVFAVLPAYDAARHLPSQARELEVLRRFSTFRRIDATVPALAELFGRAPAGLVHFGGHGTVESTAGAPAFRLELEDDDLDLVAWRGMLPPRIEHHPFLFLNACDLGRAAPNADWVDGWAPAALDLGACGVVGAIWPLDDRAAARFAERFYGALLDGAKRGAPVPIAKLVRDGRRLFVDDASPSFLAYVFYGDAHLALTCRP